MPDDFKRKNTQVQSSDYHKRKGKQPTNKMLWKMYTLKTNFHDFIRQKLFNYFP